MWHYYLKIAWHNLRKYKISSAIGIVGLAMGLLCFVLCNYCARFIAGTDKDFLNYNRIADVSFYIENSKNDLLAGTPAFAAGELRKYYSDGVDCFSVVSYPEPKNVTFELGEEETYSCVLTGVETDEFFKDIFALDLLDGNWEQINKQHNAVVISRRVANRVFGDISPLGRQMNLTEERNGLLSDGGCFSYIVMGVMEDMPQNNSLKFLNPPELYIFNDTHGILNRRDLDKNVTGCITYALLQPGWNIEQMNDRVDILKKGITFFDKNMLPQFQPLGKFQTKRVWMLEYIYRSIGWLILLVASLNYFLFIVGNFLSRLREFGIRRNFGEGIYGLFGGLVVENLLSFILVIVLAGGLLEVMQGYLTFRAWSFEFVFDSEEPFKHLLEYSLCGIVVILFFSYLISRYVEKLCKQGERNMVMKGGKLWLRNLLLGIQLFVCILFLTTCLAMYFQYEKINSVCFPNLSDVQKENILEVNLDFPQLRGHEDMIIGRLSSFPEVTEILKTDGDALFIPRITGTYVDEKYLEFHIWEADTNFASFLGIPLSEASVALSSRSVFVSEKVALEVRGNGQNNVMALYDNNIYDIVGIMAEIPVLYSESNVGKDVWKLNTKTTCCFLKTIPGTRNLLERKVNALVREFLPDEIPYQVRSLMEIMENEMVESAMRPMLIFFAAVCLLITILGIYSAISVDCIRRQKEMAIRKINGASGWQITKKFAGFYLYLVIGAFVTALPFSYWGIYMWLSIYHYQFDYGLFFWILTIMIVLVVIALTVIWKIYKVICINPVDVLRNE